MTIDELKKKRKDSKMIRKLKVLLGWAMIASPFVVLLGVAVYRALEDQAFRENLVWFGWVFIISTIVLGLIIGGASLITNNE